MANADATLPHTRGFGLTQFRSVHPGILALPLLIAVVLVNPVGYVGGGGDEWRFVQSITCWATNGPCLPQDHWGTRWPAIVPSALVVTFLGPSRWALAIAPSLFAIVALILFTDLTRRHFGWRASVLAGSALILTPIYPWLALRVGCDIPELTFLLAAGVCASIAATDERRRWPLLTGVCAALAVQSRETSIVPLAVFGLAFARHFSARQVLVMGVGFGTPLLIEALIYLWSAGDPLRRYMLAISHTAVPSTALPSDLQGKGLPFFNRQVIAGWVPASGIEAHWTIVGFVNLVVHRYVVTTFAIFAAIALVVGPWIGGRKALVRLLLLAAISTAISIYGLAIHPLPRMFFPAIAVICVCFGAIADRGINSTRRPILLSIIALAPIPPLVVVATALNTGGAERVASAWLAQINEPVGTDETTKQSLALADGAEKLTTDGDARFFIRLSLAARDCAEGLRRDLLVVAEYRLRDRGAEILCLYRIARSTQRDLRQSS